jgi:hypothetical protein
VWSWFSSPVLSSNAVALYMRRKWAHEGISRRLRAKTDRGYDWQGGARIARRTEVEGKGREGKVGWRRMPPGVCWLRAAIKKLWGSAVATVLCCAVLVLCSGSSAEKRLSAASKRANQRRPAPASSSNLIQPPKQFEAENPRLEGVPQDHLAEILCSCDC